MDILPDTSRFARFANPKNPNKRMNPDLDEIKSSIDSAGERILKEQNEFKKNAERTREEIERGVRPPGKKFRL